MSSRKNKDRRNTARPRSQSPNQSFADVPDSPPENPSALFSPLLQVRTAGSVRRRKSGEVDGGPLGLNVVYTPPNGHKADIVFIHGLGGTSRLTWSKHKQPELFWPLTFLPLEPDLCLARILTFGYDSDLKKSDNASTSILDFAKSLLYDLKYAKDEHKEDLDMGSVSMVPFISLP